MKYPDVSVDTYDFIVIAAMIGGFVSHNWIPFVIFTCIIPMFLFKEKH